MRIDMRAAAAALLIVAAAGAASAADMPHRYGHGAHERVYYRPQGPMSPVVAAPRYRVVYQVPSNQCARTNFCLDED